MFCWNVEPAPLMVPVAHAAAAELPPAAGELAAGADPVALAEALLLDADVAGDAVLLLFVPHAATASSPLAASTAAAAVREVLTR
jgi:hypothetical protein